MRSCASASGADVALRPDLDALVRELGTRGEISLDDLADAIGTRAVTPEDIDEMMSALERLGTAVASPSHGGNEQRLAIVLAAARTLAREQGRKPTPAEIAARVGLRESDVRLALFFGQVMGR